MGAMTATANNMTTIRLGYACVHTRLPSASRTMRLANASPERLLRTARENLLALRAILQWNEAEGVQVFRISSDTIPFASHPVNQLRWWEDLKGELDGVAAVIKRAGMRVSMHPGQFTVISSNKPDVIERGLAELEYHGLLLDALGIGVEAKIVLHLGGTYGDKPAAIERFCRSFGRLSASVRSRLVVENDEKSYSLKDVLLVAERLGIPVVYDVFHGRWNPSLPELNDLQRIDRAAETWAAGDGRQKIHYSDQAEGRLPGTHSRSLDLEAFVPFFVSLEDRRLDIMLEVKDKERSLLAARAALHEANLFAYSGGSRA